MVTTQRVTCSKCGAHRNVYSDEHYVKGYYITRCTWCGDFITGRIDKQSIYRYTYDYVEGDNTVRVMPTHEGAVDPTQRISTTRDNYVGDIFDQDSDFIEANLGWD